MILIMVRNIYFVSDISFSLHAVFSTSMIQSMEGVNVWVGPKATSKILNSHIKVKFRI